MDVEAFREIGDGKLHSITCTGFGTSTRTSPQRSNFCFHVELVTRNGSSLSQNKKATA